MHQLIRSDPAATEVPHIFLRLVGLWRTCVPCHLRHERLLAHPCPSPSRAIKVQPGTKASAWPRTFRDAGFLPVGGAIDVENTTDKYANDSASRPESE